jgi:hypothetical protein
VQGYLLGKPMPANEVPAFLEATSRVSASWRTSTRHLDIVADAAD